MDWEVVCGDSPAKEKSNSWAGDAGHEACAEKTGSVQCSWVWPMSDPQMLICGSEMPIRRAVLLGILLKIKFYFLFIYFLEMGP